MRTPALIGRGRPRGCLLGPPAPGRLFVNGGDLILQEKSGTGASRGPEGTPQGVRPTQLVQNPAYGKTVRHWIEDSLPSINPLFISRILY